MEQYVVHNKMPANFRSLGWLALNLVTWEGPQRHFKHSALGCSLGAQDVAAPPIFENSGLGSSWTSINKKHFNENTFPAEREINPKGAPHPKLEESASHHMKFQLSNRLMENMGGVRDQTKSVIAWS